MAANAGPIGRKVSGIFDRASISTPGLAGDTFGLTVTIERGAAGTAFGGGYLFGGGVAHLTVAGTAIFSGFGGCTYNKTPDS